MRDDLKRKAKGLALRQGVSLNNFINATVEARVAQEEAPAFFDDHLKGGDWETIRQRVLAFMSEVKPGEDPAIDDLREAMEQRF